MRGHARPYPGGQFAPCPAWLILILASFASLAWNAEGFGASRGAIEGTTLDQAPNGEFSKVVSQVNDFFERVSAPNVERAEASASASASPYSWEAQGNWWGGKVKLPDWDGLQDRRQSDFVALNPFNDVDQGQYIPQPPESSTPPTEDDESGTPHPRQASEANTDENKVTTPEALRDYDVTEQPPPLEEGTVEYQQAGDEARTEGPFENHKYEADVEQEGAENARDAEDRQDEESHADVNDSSDEEREDEPQTDVDEGTRYYEGPIPANKGKDSNRSTKRTRGKTPSSKKDARKSRKRGKARGKPQNAPQVTEDDVDDANQKPVKNRAVPTVFGVNRHYQQLGFRSPFVPLPIHSSPPKKNIKYRKYLLVPKTQRKTQRRPWGRDSRAFNYRTPHAVVQLLSGPDFVKLGLKEKRRNRPPVYRGENEDNSDGRYESSEGGNSDPEVEEAGNDSHDEDNLPQARHQLSDTEGDDAEGEITSEETSTESNDYPWDARKLEDSTEAPQNDELEPDIESSMENYHHVIPQATDEEQAESQESGTYRKHRSGHKVKSGESGGDQSSQKIGKATKAGEKHKDGSKYKNHESGVKGQKGYEIRRKKYKDKKGRWKSYVDEDEDSGSHDKHKKEELAQDHHNSDGYKTKKRAKGFRDKYNFDKSKSHNSFYQNRKHKGAWRHYGHADANYVKNEKGAKKGKYKKIGNDGDKKQEKHSSSGGHSQEDHKEWRGKTGHESKHGGQRRYKEDFKYKPGFYSWG